MARCSWDHGIPTEELLAEMRSSERQRFYLVGTPKSKISQHQRHWLDLPWQKVRESVEGMPRGFRGSVPAGS